MEPRIKYKPVKKDRAIKKHWGNKDVCASSRSSKPLPCDVRADAKSSACGPFTTKFLKCDLLEISDLIIQPPSVNDNLCLFYSVLNSLRSAELRQAFIGGSPLNDPSRAFMDVYFKFHGPVAKADVAYNSSDLQWYLIHLKSNKFIGSFLWVNRHGERRGSSAKGQITPVASSPR
jgi:hypothetical protein